MLFLDLENGVKAAKSVKGVTRVQPGTGTTFSCKTESTGGTKANRVQSNLPLTQRAPLMSKEGRLVTRQDLYCVG